MSKKKSIAVAIVLALILLIGGLLAFFTDTDTATNVFTIGDEIDITLAEDNWDPNDGLLLHPGVEVTKDPTITNDSDTSPAYVFAEVIVPCYDSDDADSDVDTPLFSLETIGSGWTLMSTSAVDTTNKTITYVYNYGDSSDMTTLDAGLTTSAVFSSVILDPDLTAEQAATASTAPNIIVNAYDIQTTDLGVTAPADIFALFTSSNP